MNPELDRKLRYLRLSGMATALLARNQEAIHHHLAYPEFLELLVEDELATRRDRLFARRLKQAGIVEVKSIESYDWSFSPQVPKGLILGLALPTTAAYILGAAIAAPALIKLGVMPLAAHLFVFYFACVSVLSPPVGAAYYAAAAIAGASINRTGWTAMKLAFAAFVVPFFFVYHPELIMKGTALNIIAYFVVTSLGLAIFAMAVEGTAYFGGIKWYPWHRILLLISAVGFIIPGWFTFVVGLALLAVVLLSHRQIVKLTSTKLKWGRRRIASK